MKPGDTAEDLCRACRKKMFDGHPDRGGSEATARALTAAFEDLKKRIVGGRLVDGRAIPDPVVVRRGVTILIRVGTRSAYQPLWGPTAGPANWPWR